MTGSQKELNELKDLQEHSQKLRKQRDVVQKEAESAPQVSTEEASDAAMQTEPVLTAENEGSEEGLTGQIADIMTELEEAAAEHPSLALLAAFGIGIFVGQLLSRR